MRPVGAGRVPFFSQWETPDLTLDVLARGEAALLEDPRWAESGAGDPVEYARWAGHVCGMACLKMVIAAETGRVVPTLELARMATEYGGYVVDGGAIRGLVYAPAVRMLGERFGMEAAVVTEVAAEDWPELLRRWRYVIASVHPDIRWPERPAPGRGGHLVLVTGATAEGIVFHNPSGHHRASQVDASVPPRVFGRFFAGRGIGVVSATGGRAAGG